MLTKTPIEWCYNGTSYGYSWNVADGCNEVSAGCAHCYAKEHARRFWGARAFSDVRIHADRLALPLRLTKPANIFVNSMSDLFHEAISTEVIQSMVYVMEATPHLHYIALTKRAKRMCAEVPRLVRSDGTTLLAAPLANFTLGVSVENNCELQRVDYLQRTPVAQRIISFEPLLEEINAMSAIRSVAAPIHHAIIGGESGGKARACHLDWISSLIAQCDLLNIGVFVKQLGARAMCRTPGWNDTSRRYHTKARKGNDPEEWPYYLRRRELLHPARDTSVAHNYQQF